MDLESDERDSLPSDKEIHPLDPQTSQDTDKNPIHTRVPREANKKASENILKKLKRMILSILFYFLLHPGPDIWSFLVTMYLFIK